MILKFIQIFLVPSVFIFLLFLISLFLLFLNKKKKARILLIFALTIYSVFSLGAVSNKLIFWLEKDLKPISRKDLSFSQIIVVLSGGGKGKDIPFPSNLSESSILRALEAWRIFKEKKGEAQIIISGRGRGEENEALVIKNLLKELGVEDEKIQIEDKSKNTYESAKNLKEMISSKRIFLVTSAFHIKRAEIIFKKFNFSPLPSPCDFRAKDSYEIWDFLPFPQNLKNSDIAIKEYLGILYYKFFK